MTPNEKAAQLVVDNQLKVKSLDYKEAVQCAIVTVDEILKNFQGLHKPEYCSFDAIGERKFTFQGEYNEHMTGYDMIEYWQEVKQILEKL